MFIITNKDEFEDLREKGKVIDAFDTSTGVLYKWTFKVEKESLLARVMVEVFTDSSGALFAHKAVCQLPESYHKYNDCGLDGVEELVYYEIKKIHENRNEDDDINTFVLDIQQDLKDYFY